MEQAQEFQLRDLADTQEALLMFLTRDLDQDALRNNTDWAFRVNAERELTPSVIREALEKVLEASSTGAADAIVMNARDWADLRKHKLQFSLWLAAGLDWAPLMKRGFVGSFDEVPIYVTRIQSPGNILVLLPHFSTSPNPGLIHVDRYKATFP